MKKLFLIVLFITQIYAGPNQTDTVTSVLVNTVLPFKITIELTDFQIPDGIQSMAVGQDGYNYLFITGRTNGLHGFANSDDFPPSKQNTTVFVVNTNTRTVFCRSLFDRSGLSQHQIDLLSVVSAQSYQSGNTLYITGGYGIDTQSGMFSTKDTLTAINIPGLINWVTQPNCCSCASAYIRQISNPVFQVTGGEMVQYGQCPTLLIFGQNFIGNYDTSANGIYTKQVRRFNIIDDGNHLNVEVLNPSAPEESFRRRDLNIIPIIKTNSGKKIPAYVALSGVFTLDTGIWTVPVEITAGGNSIMSEPNFASTFKQAMNNYNSAHIELLTGNGDMYSILFGGLTFGFFEDNQFKTDTSIPFTNQITAIKRSPIGEYQQILLPIEFPTILSTESNPGNTLRFGAGARFIIEPNIPVFSNRVLDLKSIKTTTIIGYIVGGIQSTVPNTSTITDSAASPYIFKVTLTPP
ncbi:MAG: hypothetical protein WDZ41_02595 [Candidatus Babeliales bacterium]